MSNTELVMAGLKAWEADDEAKLSSLLAENFVFSGPVPQPLDKAGFLGFMHIMLTAFPDFAFNVSHIEENGDTVTVHTHITGTHTGTLALPGMPAIPAAGKKIALPHEIQTYSVKNGKVSSLATDARPDAGIPAILAQIGVTLPQ